MLGRRRLLGPLDLEVHRGEVLAVLGPSGAGKSTLLRAVNRLLPEGVRLKGEVRLGGVLVSGRADEIPHLRRAAGMLLQRPVALPGTVAENLALVRQVAGLPARWRDIEPFAAQAGLPSALLQRPAGSLSGGELQRLALARALALEPGLLLLDEPTSALDPVATRTVEASLLALRGAVTLLWVTHDPRQAQRVAARAVVVWEGRIVADGPVAELRRSADPRLRLLLD